MYRSNRSVLMILISTLLLGACAQLPTQSASSEVDPTEIPAKASLVPLPSQDFSPTKTPIGAPATGNAWIEYRDSRFGIGLAYPCWWKLTPMPADGMGGFIGLRSFDEAYVLSHTIKGEWQDGVFPEGVFAIDIVVTEQIDPAKSNEEAWNSMLDPTMSSIVASEEIMIGQNQASMIEIKNMVNSRDPNAIIYLFRLTPNKIMLFSVLQQDKLDSPDIQGILTSLSLNLDQAIILPDVAPHAPLIAAPCVEK
jgi:hypothetical protein